MRRVESASFVAQPKLHIPKTAKKRQQRNFRRVQLPVASLKRVLFSARWLSLALLVVVVYALATIGLSEQFYLTTIPVEGTGAVPAAEVVAASGLAGNHIFAADPMAAAEAILTVPGVLSAAVTVQWPNLVQIQVKEETPIMIWQSGEERYWVTDNGRLLPARVEMPGLLTVQANTAVAEMDTAVGEGEGETASQPPFVSQEVLLGALLLRQLRPNIDQLQYEPGNGLSFQDGRGWRVYFGRGTDMEQKLVVYEQIVADLEARSVTPVYISVANQQRPFYLGN